MDVATFYVTVTLGCFIMAVWVDRLEGYLFWGAIGLLSLFKAFREDWKVQKAKTKTEAKAEKRRKLMAEQRRAYEQRAATNEAEWQAYLDGLTTGVKAEVKVAEPKPEPKIWTKADIIEHFGEDAEISLGRATFKAKDLNGG